MEPITRSTYARCQGEVTGLLASGKNVISALLGDGWYGSPLTWIGMHFFPPPDRFLAQLELDYADGSRETVVTDGSWKAAACNNTIPGPGTL